MCCAASGWRRPPWWMSPVRSMSAMAASTGISRARLRCAKRWRNAGSIAPTRRSQKIAESSGPAPARLEHWLRTLFAIKHKKVCDDPEMFATYLTLAREACKVVKAHKDSLIDQIAHILSDGVKQGAFEVADVKASSHAIFDATSRFHHPAHCGEWSDPQARRPDRRLAGAAAQRPGSAAQALIAVHAEIPAPCLQSDCAPAAAICLISLNSGTSPADKFGAEESVLLAVFADIHANRQAFSACLDFARAHGAEQIICLGDYVGYGADPEWTVETVMGLVDRRRHRRAWQPRQRPSARPPKSMNAEAQAAIEWTRGRLSAAQRRFLAELPLTLQEEDRLYVHSEASSPAKWRYVQSTADAARSMIATEAHVTFCGHIHRPALYSMSVTGKMTSFIPTAGVTVQLLAGRRWLAVLGSVGQPRDGDPAASFAMFDTSSGQITYCRVPYDVDAAAKRIRENGLPHWLADRLRSEGERWRKFRFSPAR